MQGVSLPPAAAPARNPVAPRRLVRHDGRVTMHADEITVSEEAARYLIGAQFPRWRGLPVRRVPGAGTVNAIFRVGDGHAARFPLQGGDPAKVLSGLRREAEAAAEFARYSPFPAPQPVAIGEPGAGYPLPWSVQTWLPGAVATPDHPADREAFAEDLAALIAALRAADTRGRQFRGTGRGGDLRAHDEWMEECFAKSEGLLEVAPLREAWRRLRELPRPAADAMAHGDLIPGNVLVEGGRLAGVLDTGGFAPADPALDLVAAWHLLEAGPRAVLRGRLGCDDLQWARGQAWALEQAMGLVWYYAQSNPVMAALGRRTLERLLADGPAC
jgi:aminoglycoside phosphotransferase (APT) family kinase protein